MIVLRIAIIQVFAPQCRLEEFERKYKGLEEERKGKIGKIVLWSILAVISVFIYWAIVFLPVLFIVINAFKVNALARDMQSLDKEIVKLRAALRQGSGKI